MFRAFIFFIVLIFVESCQAQCIIIVEMPNYQVLFGTQSPVYDRGVCHSNCSEDTNCIGYDWDNNDPGCFMFSNFESDPQPNDNVDHYIFIRKKEFCTGEFVTETWKPEINKTSIGVKDLVDAESLQTCIENCLLMLECVGVDWYQVNKSCWIVSKSNSLEESPHVYHYKRVVRDNRPQPIETSPLTLRPAYIVIIGLGLGCILMTVVAIVVIMTRKRSKGTNVENISPTKVLDEDEVSYQYSEKNYSDQQDTLSRDDEFEKYKADNEVFETEQTLDTIQ